MLKSWRTAEELLAKQLAHRQLTAVPLVLLLYTDTQLLRSPLALPVGGKLLTLAMELLFGTQLLLLLAVEEEFVLAAPLGAACAVSTFMLLAQWFTQLSELRSF